MKRNEIILGPDFSRQVEALYRDMEAAYDNVAGKLGFSCAGCPDNCCDSYFLHYTYTEWAYLWQGLRMVDESLLHKITDRAARYVTGSEAAMAAGKRPMLMCPLNAEGLCSLYSHRLMICRLHGVPSTFTRPDGQQLDFPGCFRWQEQKSPERAISPLDRTRVFRRMVELELGLLGHRRTTAPKVKMSIAQMIVKGPPVL